MLQVERTISLLLLLVLSYWAKPSSLVAHHLCLWIPSSLQRVREHPLVTLVEENQVVHSLQSPEECKEQENVVWVQPLQHVIA